MGELNQDILDEWEFWKVVNHNSNFLIFEDKLSFEDLQKLNAVLDQNEDYEKAINQYFREESERERMIAKTGNKK